MLNQANRNVFELEFLEPRILLSGDPVLAPGAEMSAGNTVVAEVVSGENVTSEASQFGINDTFQGLVEQPLTSPNPQNSPEQLDANKDSAEINQAGILMPLSEVSSETELLTDSLKSFSFGAESNSQAQILVETLHAANSPPESTGGGESLNSGNQIQKHGITASSVIIQTFSFSSLSLGENDKTTIKIGGNAGAGVNPNGFDRIDIASSATLSGTLEIKLVNGFVPSAGDSFSVITWDTYNGEFSNYLGTAGIAGHPELAFRAEYAAHALTLTVIQTPSLIPGARATIDSGLDVLSQIGTGLNTIGDFAKTLPLIGGSVGSLVNLGTTLANSLKQRLYNLLGTPLPQAGITAAIEGWNNTTFAGFTFEVKGVRGLYGIIDTDPFAYQLDLVIKPGSVNRALQTGAGAVLGALFSPAPNIQVDSALELDMTFGIDGTFYVQIDHLTASVKVQTSDLTAPIINFSSLPGGVSLNITSGYVDFKASVTATPDPSVLVGNRITASSLSTIASSTTNIGNAFNYAKAGTVDAALTLTGALGVVGAVQYSGVHTLRIQSANVFSGADPDVTLTINGSMTVLSQTLQGIFTLKKTSTETIIEASGVSFDLNAGAGTLKKRILRLTNGSGKFLLLSGELAGTLTVTLSAGSDIAGINITGTNLNLAFNTSSGSISSIDGTSVSLPVGPYFRTSGTVSIGLATPEISLSGSFAFEPYDPTPLASGSGDEVVTVAVSGLNFALSDAVSSLLQISAGTGVLVFTNQGLMAQGQATVGLVVPGMTLTGSFGFKLNTTGTPYNSSVTVAGSSVAIALPGGPYISISATGAALGVMGLDLTGDFAFEQKNTSTGGEKVVTVAASNVQFPLGTLTRNVLNVTNVSGGFILTSAGIAGNATATVGISLAGATLGGAFGLRVNSTSAAVNETVQIGGISKVINVPVGPYFQVSGTGVSFGLLGLSLTGDFSFERKETTGGKKVVTVAAQHVAFNFGTSLINLTEGQALFLVTDTGLAGQASITVTINAFGKTFEQPFDWSFNDNPNAVDETFADSPAMPAPMAATSGEHILSAQGFPDLFHGIDLPQGPFNRLSSHGPVTFSFNVGGQTQTVTTEMVLELVDADPDYVAVGLSSFQTRLGGGSVYLDIQNGTGALRLNGDGIAGEITVGSVTLHGASLISLTASNLKLRVNNTGKDVASTTISISDGSSQDVTFSFTGSYYQNYFAISGAAEIGLTDFSFVTLKGVFTFEVSGATPNQLKVGGTDIQLEIRADSKSVLSLQNGHGAFLVTGDGLAGIADLEYEVGIIGISGSIKLEVNTTASAVITTVTTGSGITTLNLPNTHYLRILVDGYIHYGGLALPFGFIVQVNSAAKLVEFRRLDNNDLLLTIDKDGHIDLKISVGSFDFGAPGPFEFVSMLRQVVNWLGLVQGSDLFDVKIPFTSDATLGDALNWSQLFIDRIYSSMTGVELQGQVDLAAHSSFGKNFSFKLTLNDAAPVTVSVSDAVFSTLQQVVDYFNAALATAGLSTKVEARINNSGTQPIFAIALTPAEAAKHNKLSISFTSTTADPNPLKTIFAFNDGQIGLATSKYSTSEFVTELGRLLTGTPGSYDAAIQTYSFPININKTYNTSVPFNFGGDVGSIAGAKLTGTVNLGATVRLTCTLGFDLSASEVPRVLTASLVPVPANGRLTTDAHFALSINGDTAPVWYTLAAASTSTNNSIYDLANDFNDLFAASTYKGTALNTLVYAQKAGSGLAISGIQETDADHDGVIENEDLNRNGVLDSGEDTDHDGVLDLEDLNNNHALDAKLGIVNRLDIISLQNDAFATELGFGTQPFSQSGQNFFVSAAKSSIKGLFLDGVNLTGSLSVTVPSISGSLRLGFVEIGTSGGSLGTLAYNGTTSNPITATISLRDKTTGATRFFVSELFSSTSSVNLANMITGPDLHGSFLVRLKNISVTGFSFPLCSSPEISLWIPNITSLSYNANPYDAVTNNKGLFISMPSLGHLLNFDQITFSSMVQAISKVSDNLSQLSAFSFLDEKLPLIDISVNDLLDYAAKFATFVDSLTTGNADSLQTSISAMENEVEKLFDLSPDVLSIELDNGGITDFCTSGAVDGSSPATYTFNPSGSNNGVRIRSTDNDIRFNNVSIYFVGSSLITGNSARATYDAAAKLLRVQYNPGVTTANAVISAINGLAGGLWIADLVAGDDGTGAFSTTALKFSLTFTTGYANSLPFQLDLAKLISQIAGDNTAAKTFLDVAKNFIKVSGSGVLTVSASAALTLKFGLDLSNPSKIRPFLYDDTGVKLLAKVLGTNIDFEASLGSVAGIFIKGATITIDSDGNPDTGPAQNDQGASFVLGLKDNNGDGRHYFDENWLNLQNINLTLTGGIKATLPIYAPLASTPLGGDTDANADGYPDNYMVLDIPDLVRLFVDDQAAGHNATILFAGLNNDFVVVSATANNYQVKFVNNPSLGSSASAVFSGNTLTVTIKNGITKASEAITAIQAVSGFSATHLSADDDGNPITTTNNGNGTLKKIDIITPDFRTIFDNIGVCDILDSSAGLLLDGLDSLLESVQNGLNEVVSSTSLPLIGDGLSGAANFIENFRGGLLARLRKALDDAGGSAITAIENAIKQAFWEVLGPDGLNLLVKTDGNPLDPALGYQQLEVTLDCDEGLVVNLRLKKEQALVDTTANPINFDIGVPGLGLSVNGNVVVALGFDLKFGFGLSKADGFYFNSSASGSDPELKLYFKAEIPGLTATGQLAFLQLEVTDDSESPSKFEGHFIVDLKDPDNDGKLTFAELTSSGTQFSDIISANLEAIADVNLAMIASFGGNTSFPRVLADFNLDWSWDLVHGSQGPTIAFNNIYLDLGSFISDFFGPILTEIRKVTEPLQPIIDVATARIPVLSDLAGEDITLLDLAEVFGLLEPSTVEFIDGVIQVVTLINDLDGIGEGSILIPFGGFNLGSDSSGHMNQIQALQSLSEIDMAQVVNDASGPGVSETYKSQTSKFAGDVGSLDNFSIPIFKNPMELFNLFIGEPVRLIEWRMPTFKFEFTYVQKIPIYPPLYAQFGGSIGATINIGFGYDTYGIQKFIESEDKNALDLLDGFYVLDFDANGKDINELELKGEIFAGASIDLFMVEVGVNGGIGATVGFDLNDINNDGKVRVSEIIANAEQDPRCIFNINGRIYLFLEAFLKVDLFFFSIDKTWRFADITLFEFSITCPQPVLAAYDTTTKILTLNAGSRASNRGAVDTNDNSETFIVKHVDGTSVNETVEVQWGNYREEHQSVAKIVVEDAGAGNDYLDFRGVLCPVDVNGGIGNDTIYLSDGVGSVAHGGDGNDTITASSSEIAINIVIYGDGGNDILTAGPASITIHGGDGTDTITGSPLADTLYGDGGPDIIDAGNGDDAVYGGDGDDTIEGYSGNDLIYGEGGADKLRGSRGDDLIYGGDGDDEIYGGSGNDLLVGGYGNDKVYGQGGIDVLVGDNCDRVLVDGTEVTLAQISATLLNIGTKGVTIEGITGKEDPAKLGNDFLVGGGNIDILLGGDGNDFLYGGNFFANGDTEVIEEDFNDFFDGGRGNDQIFGDDAMGRTGDRDTGITIQSSIFYDNNKNNIKDAEEAGFGGVTVKLYTVSGPTLVATEVTNPDGSFEFKGLDPKNYYFVFSPVAGYTFVAQYNGVAGAKAEDSDIDGDTDASGRTGNFTLTFDETETHVTAGYQGDPIISISDVTVTENNTGQTQAAFQVTLSGIQTFAVSVKYATADGTAKAGKGDYTSVSGTLVFGPGELSKQIVIMVSGDAIYENDEQFTLTLSNPSAGVKLPATATVLGTILNDDPVPQISIKDYSPLSNAHESDDAVFTVTLSNPSDFTVKVGYRTDSAYCTTGTCGTLLVDDAAIPFGLGPNPDFIMQNGTLVFAPGVTQQKIVVKVLSDNLDENDEQFYVDLFNPEMATIADNRGYGIIPDDDQEVSVTIEAKLPSSDLYHTDVLENNVSPVTVEFLVKLVQNGVAKESGKTVTVTYSTSPGTAIETTSILRGIFADYESVPNDYQTGELEFAPGETEKTITVQVYADNLVESDENFYVNLIGVDNAQIARNPAKENNHVTVTIKSNAATSGVDNGPWAICFDRTEYEVQEPESGSSFVEVTLRRAAGSSHAVAVFYTSGGSAAAGIDYGTIFRQEVSFAVGELVKTARIQVYSDSITEGDETVYLFLKNPTGGPTRAEPDQAKLTIHDGDLPKMWIEPPTLLVFPIKIYGINEGSTETNVSKTFKVYLDTPAGPGGAEVYYQTISLTARAGEDFTTTTGTLHINTGNTEGSISVPVYGDKNSELTETFAVRLTNVSGATLTAGDSVAVAKIYDDDLTEITGQVFYDSNRSGFMDLKEKGIKGVDVEITWYQSGIEQSSVVQTDASGIYRQNVTLGPVTIVVDGNTVTSPYKSFPILIGSGTYTTTTDNEAQTAEFDGVLGISPYEKVGYMNSFTFVFPTANDDVGRGGTDDTIFGGPGNDLIDAGAGDDHVVGGHWTTATDSNAEVNQTKYNAVIKATTTGLHSIYGGGPIFYIDTSSSSSGGSISGQIWIDSNLNNQQDAGERLLTQEVMVTLLDCDGNPVNAVPTTTGLYQFSGISLKADGTTSKYSIRFDIPAGLEFVSPGIGLATRDSDAINGGRTGVIEISLLHPAAGNIDAGVKSSSLMPGVGVNSFVFDELSYSVSESVKGGVLSVTIVRDSAYQGRSVVIRAEDGADASGVAAAHVGINYAAVSQVLYFAVGETAKSVNIQIVNSHGISFCETLQFRLYLRDVTGRPMDDAVVYLYSEGVATNPDDDMIAGGDDWDIILGDSGNIPAYAVIGPFAQRNLPQYLGDIKRNGGPGKDDIDGGNGPDYIDGQLGDDELAGGEGLDYVDAGLGNDRILAELDDDQLDGQHGKDTIVSQRDVPVIQLATSGLTSTLIHATMEGGVLSIYSTFTLRNIEIAKILGGDSDNSINLRGWLGSAFVSGGNGQDTLLVEGDTDMILSDWHGSVLDRLFFLYANGFSKDASISLASGANFQLGGIEKVYLRGGVGDNRLDASGYSRKVTLEGMSGDDQLIGGSNNDTFVFIADTALGNDTITGNGGIDTLDFTGTLSNVTVDLSKLDPLEQSVNANLNLVLIDKLEGVTGGSGNDLLIGNDLDNILSGGLGDDELAGGPGSETYVFDTDEDWGSETVTENAGDSGLDKIDFSGTKHFNVSLDLSIIGTYQKVNDHLDLKIMGEGVDEVVGGEGNDVLRGNRFDNTLRGGKGSDILDGKGGNDLLDGGAGNDSLYGGLGDNDRIIETADTNFALTNSSLKWKNGEVDSLDGIENAKLVGGLSANTFTITGWTGRGEIQGSGGFDTLIAAFDANFTITDVTLIISTSAGPITIGSIESAKLSGGPGNNTLDASGFSGSATLKGGEGNDILVGGKGPDTINGDSGDDTLTGNQGNDVLDGGAGSDTVTETMDATWFILLNDWLYILRSDGLEYNVLKSLENVVLNGGAGVNYFNITGWNAGNLTINGEGGNDIVGASGGQTLIDQSITLTDSSLSFNSSSFLINLVSVEGVWLVGGGGNDLLDAGNFTGAVLLQGGAGNDRLIGGKGVNILEGGDGNDTFVFKPNSAAEFCTVTGGAGEDTLDFSAFATGVQCDLSNISSVQTTVAGDLLLRFTAEDIEDVVGSSGADTITGNSLNNKFTTNGGGDQLNGGGGANWVIETVSGTMILTDISLTINGITSILSGIQLAQLTGGSGDDVIDATGFSGSTLINGLDGNDTIAGGSGIDRLVGGAGDDVLRGNAGNDIYIFDVDFTLGRDTIEDSGGIDTLDFSATASKGLSIDLAITGAEQTVEAANLKLILAVGCVIENVLGGDGNDVLRGNAADNFFSGGLGADQIDGAGGSNTVVEVRDADFFLTNAALTIGMEINKVTNVQMVRLTGGEGNNRIDASAFSVGSVTLYGMGGDDVLMGGTGNDLLDGGEGNDSLYGGAGNDLLLGRNGNDLLNGGADLIFLPVGDDDQLVGGLGNDTYVFDQSQPLGLLFHKSLGSDTITEIPLGGSYDIIVGAGINGIDIDLSITTTQVISSHLKITLTYGDTIENAL